jgi:hypothetical protein
MRVTGRVQASRRPAPTPAISFRLPACPKRRRDDAKDEDRQRDYGKQTRPKHHVREDSRESLTPVPTLERQPSRRPRTAGNGSIGSHSIDPCRFRKSYPGIAVMQPGQDWHDDDRPGSLDRALKRYIFVQSQVRALPRPVGRAAGAGRGHADLRIVWLLVASPSRQHGAMPATGLDGLVGDADLLELGRGR